MSMTENNYMSLAHIARNIMTHKTHDTAGKIVIGDTDKNEKVDILDEPDLVPEKDIDKPEKPLSTVDIVKRYLVYKNKRAQQKLKIIDGDG